MLRTQQVCRQHSSVFLTFLISLLVKFSCSSVETLKAYSLSPFLCTYNKSEPTFTITLSPHRAMHLFAIETTRWEYLHLCLAYNVKPLYFLKVKRYVSFKELPWTNFISDRAHLSLFYRQHRVVKNICVRQSIFNFRVALIKGVNDCKIGCFISEWTR